MHILYDSQDLYYKSPFGVLSPGQNCIIRLRIPKQIEPRFVQLVIEREDGNPAREFAFAWAGQDGPFDIFKCDFTLDGKGLFFYWFRVTGKSGEKWQLSVIPNDFHVPAAFQGAVMYQIFPDRFCKLGDCDLSGKLEPYVLRSDWGGQPEYRPDPGCGEILCNDFFGGNFRGITSKLDYLFSLGVRVLYLNPICMAFSNHRYDTADYKRPDPMLGTEEDFRALCDGAHRRGIRVIIDGVYSHTGANSVYFDRDRRFGNGAYSRGPESPYFRWYSFLEYPDRYDSWWGFATLPNVNELEPDYLRYIIEDDDSVIAHWLALGVDGFRLDVADELPDEFIRRFKGRLRQLKPDALLIGEVWEDASNKSAYSVRRRYFTDGELDSVMNYPWRTAIINFIRGMDDGTALGQSIMTIAENYPREVLHALMNSLGTHDTMRILTTLIGDFAGDREYQAQVRLSYEQRQFAFERLKMAAFLQYALPGCPCIYYGDEAGMEGCKDPFNRGCFPWGQEDRRFTELYRTLGELKNNSPALQRGEVHVREAGSGRIVFTRSLDGQTLLCCACRTGEPIILRARHAALSYNCLRDGDRYTVRPGGFGCFAVES